MTTTEITFRTVKLTVEGTYTAEDRGYSYDNDLGGQPYADSEFEINSIWAGEVEIYELFSWADLEEIERECLINIEA